jgi:hypothetical protein
MTDPDFRALCAALADDLEISDWPSKLKGVFRADIDRARAALAQPASEPPTDFDNVPHAYAAELRALVVELENYKDFLVDGYNLSPEGKAIAAWLEAEAARAEAWQ